MFGLFPRGGPAFLPRKPANWKLFMVITTGSPFSDDSFGIPLPMVFKRIAKVDLLCCDVGFSGMVMFCLLVQKSRESDNE
ncbi:hypothetical protein Tco_1403211 [Tanacetum coccineum]